jgi:hypothetical protein
MANRSALRRQGRPARHVVVRRFRRWASARWGLRNAVGRYEAGRAVEAAVRGVDLRTLTPLRFGPPFQDAEPVSGVGAALP